MILALLLCCSDPMPGNVDKPEKDTHLVLIENEPIPDEPHRVVTYTGQSAADVAQQQDVKETLRNTRQARGDSDCIRAFLSDEQKAPEGWVQPSYDEYERDGCRSKLFLDE